MIVPNSSPPGGFHKTITWPKPFPFTCKDSMKYFRSSSRKICCDICLGYFLNSPSLAQAGRLAWTSAINRILFGSSSVLSHSSESSSELMANWYSPVCGTVRNPNIRCPIEVFTLMAKFRCMYVCRSGEWGKKGHCLRLSTSKPHTFHFWRFSPPVSNCSCMLDGRGGSRKERSNVTVLRANMAVTRVVAMHCRRLINLEKTAR